MTGMVSHDRKRPVTGPRKIEMKKVENKEKREVTFSKRRKGLFGKASELSLLCGVEVFIVVYSPSGDQPYVFSSSSPEAIISRFMGLNMNQAGPYVDSRVNEYRKQERDLLLQLEEAKKLQGINRGCEHWWMGPIEDIQDMEELEYCKKRLQKLKEKVELKAEELNTVANAAAGKRFDDDTGSR